MSLSNLGSCGFLDLFAPAKSKNEWGVDTLTRKLTGARSLLEAFIATLAQGQVFQGYFLQTWEPDDNPTVATIALNYKGLLTGGTPTPRIETQITAASGSASISFAAENSGFGRVYRRIPLYTQPTLVDPSGAVIESVVVAGRDIYTTGAQMEFTYDAVQSVYRYVTQGRQDAPRYDVVDSSFVPTVIDARGITADGSSFGKSGGLFFAFNLQPIERVIGFTAVPVIGSPFYECEDVVRKELAIPPLP